MLILTRSVGQTIMIGDDTKIVVLGIKGNHVRVGFNAPKSVPVHREEVYERIKMEGARQTEQQQNRRAEQMPAASR